MDNTKKYFGNFKKDARGQGIDVFRIVMAVVIVGAILGILFMAMPKDKDHDGIMDNMDNCPFVCNPSQLDVDSDGCGDGCELEADVKKHNADCNILPPYRNETFQNKFNESTNPLCVP